MHQDIHAWYGSAKLIRRRAALEHPADATHIVVVPAWLSVVNLQRIHWHRKARVPRLSIAEVQRGRFVAATRDQDVLLDRHGQDSVAAVVYVFADQVHSAWSSHIKFGLNAECAYKRGLEAGDSPFGVFVVECGGEGDLGGKPRKPASEMKSF